MAADLNKCGCSADSAGGCYCTKNAKCGCPGECEPKNCEAQRQKQFDREIQIETRKAAEAARKRAPKNGADPVAPDDAAPRHSGAAKRGGGMSAAQKRELSRLLTLHLAEHPSDRDRKVADLLGDLPSSERSGDQAKEK
jgi:hypothetical protein